MRDKNIAESNFSLIDRKGVEAYMRHMQDWDRFGPQINWSLQDHNFLTDRFRQFAWVLLWKESAKAIKNRKAPTEEAVEQMRRILVHFQEESDAAEAEIKAAEQRRLNAFWDFRKRVGITEYDDGFKIHHRYMGK